MVDVLNGAAPGMGEGQADFDRELRRVVAPPPFSKFLRNVLIVFGGLALLAVVLVVLRETTFSPRAAVDGYLSALEERDTNAALARLDPSMQRANSPLLRAPVVRNGDYTPPTKHQITSVESEGDRSTVTVSITVGGAVKTKVFHLVRDPASLSKVFRAWRITDGLGSLSVNWPYGDNLIVAQQTMPLEGGGIAAAPAFPGTYVIKADSAVLDAAPITVAVDYTNQPVPQFTVSLKPSAVAEVRTQIESVLTRCAAQTTLQLNDCPFGASAPNTGTVSNIAWSITAAPVYEIGIQPSYVAVSTTQPGKVELSFTYTDVSGTSTEGVPQTYPISVDGYIVSEQGKATYRVSSEN